MKHCIFCSNTRSMFALVVDRSQLYCLQHWLSEKLGDALMCWKCAKFRVRLNDTLNESLPERRESCSAEIVLSERESFRWTGEFPVNRRIFAERENARWTGVNKRVLGERRSVDDLVNGRWMMCLMGERIRWTRECSMDERVLWARGFCERGSARWMREPLLFTTLLQ